MSKVIKTAHPGAEADMEQQKTTPKSMAPVKAVAACHYEGECCDEGHMKKAVHHLNRRK